MNISTPCSPFFTTSVRGPIARIARAAFTRFHSPDELAGLRVVDQQHLDPPQRLPQLLGLAVDPEVHRVAGHDPGPLDLLEHLALQDGVDVAEEDDLGARGSAAGIFGSKNSKTLRSVQMVSRELRSSEYWPCQWKVLPSIRSSPSRSMGRPAEGRELLLPEVVAHHPHQVHRGEEGGGHREEGRAAAEHALGAAEGRLDGVVGDAADDQDGHAISSPTACSGRRSGASSRFTASGTSSGAVTQRVLEGAWRTRTPRGIGRRLHGGAQHRAWRSSAFFPRIAMICSAVTASCSGCQQS